MRFNVVTGLPRTGSTLLCNILNQNPDFYASSTSPLPIMLQNYSGLWSRMPEISSMLIRDKTGTEERLVRTMQAIVYAWYMDKADVVFDKSRGWSNNALMLNQLFPDALIIVMVRDLRAVFGSIEKQHQKNPVLDSANDPMGKTLYTRADQMFSPQGIIGGPLFGIEDLVRRRPKNVVFLQYEAFASNPEFVMKDIYSRLRLDYFEHDFEKVENTSEDVDELYLDKFEHRGEGKVKPVDPDEWKKYISPDLGSLIMQRYPFYNRAFNYTL